MTEELELIRRNVTPAQFCASVRYQIKQHKLKGIDPLDIDLNYWAAGNDLNFHIDNCNNHEAACECECSISKPYEMQTYIRNWDGTVFNQIMEFSFDTEKTGTGYFYFRNDIV